MLELFLLTSILDSELLRIQKLLQGYCEMAPVPVLSRRLLWSAPQVPKQKGFEEQHIERQPPQKKYLWQNLQAVLVRQAYLVTTVYPISRDHFRSDVEMEGVESEGGEKKMTLDEMPGMLHWADMPDPYGAGTTNSRTTISIENERGLCSLLRSVGYNLRSELIEKGYRFVNGSIVITLLRYYDVKTALRSTIHDNPPDLSSTLPSYDSLLPFDAESKWVVTVRADVLNPKDQEHVKKGTDELAAFRDAFEGVFEFPPLERRMLDTRVRFGGWT